MPNVFEPGHEVLILIAEVSSYCSAQSSLQKCANLREAFSTCIHRIWDWTKLTPNIRILARNQAPLGSNSTCMFNFLAKAI